MGNCVCYFDDGVRDRDIVEIKSVIIRPDAPPARKTGLVRQISPIEAGSSSNASKPEPFSLPQTQGTLAQPESIHLTTFSMTSIILNH